MNRDRAIQVINAEIENCNSTSLSELIYEFVVDKEITKKTIRDKAIKSEFNSMFLTDVKIMDIYTSLSCSYNLSEDQIRYIIRN